MPIPDSDITVHIPMKAFVSQPGAARGRPVILYVRDVPSKLWKDGLAALLLQHFDIQCEVKAEYAPDFRFDGRTFPGLLHRGVIKAELQPAPTCDFSKLPKSVLVDGKPIKLQVHGHHTAPQSLPGRTSPSSPRAQAASGSRRRAHTRPRKRGAKSAQGAQPATAQEMAEAREEDMPPPPAHPSSPPPPGPLLLQSATSAAPHDGVARVTSHEESARPLPAPPGPAASDTSGGAAPLALQAPVAASGEARAAAPGPSALPPQAVRTDPPVAADSTTTLTTMRASPVGSPRASPTRGNTRTRAAKPTAATPSTPHARDQGVAGLVSPNRYAPLADDVAGQEDHEMPYPGEATMTCSVGRRAPSARIAALTRKTYTDKGPIPVVSSGGQTAAQPMEPPIPGAV